MNAYHKFLIKHRIFCERGNGEHLARATQVIKDEKFRDICVCSFHGKGKVKEGYGKNYSRSD